MGQYETFLQTHALFWFITMVLFALTVILLRSGKVRLAKFIQMTLRVFYILVFITGGALIVLNMWWGSLLKGILSFVLIYIMELITNRMAKKTLSLKNAVVFWLLFIIVFLVVLYMGYFG